VSIPAWHEEPIGKSHDRTGFDCGEAQLSEFLQRHARKSHEAGGGKTFVAVSDADKTTVFGFYSLSPAAVEYARTPDIVRHGLARYDVPAFRLARLGVDRTLQGHGPGGQLLLAAGRRCLRAAAEAGGVALLIDARNEGVAKWYALYGALPLQDSPLTLMLPLATLDRALKAVDRRSIRPE
jgi:GNAT superfamily N-acetyltransferase